MTADSFSTLILILLFTKPAEIYDCFAGLFYCFSYTLNTTAFKKVDNLFCYFALSVLFLVKGRECDITTEHW